VSGPYRGDEETKEPPRNLPNDFESVARRLGCDDNKDRFEKKLGKIGRAKLEEPVKGSRAT
jgi:hypothetical protein